MPEVVEQGFVAARVTEGLAARHLRPSSKASPKERRIRDPTGLQANEGSAFLDRRLSRFAFGLRRKVILIVREMCTPVKRRELLTCKPFIQVRSEPLAPYWAGRKTNWPSARASRVEPWSTSNWSTGP